MCDKTLADRLCEAVRARRTDLIDRLIDQQACSNHLDSITHRTAFYYAQLNTTRTHKVLRCSCRHVTFDGQVTTPDVACLVDDIDVLRRYPIDQLSYHDANGASLPFLAVSSDSAQCLRRLLPLVTIHDATIPTYTEWTRANYIWACILYDSVKCLPILLEKAFDTYPMDRLIRYVDEWVAKASIDGSDDILTSLMMWCLDRNIPCDYTYCLIQYDRTDVLGTVIADARYRARYDPNYNRRRGREALFHCVVATNDKPAYFVILKHLRRRLNITSRSMVSGKAPIELATDNNQDDFFITRLGEDFPRDFRAYMATPAGSALLHRVVSIGLESAAIAITQKYGPLLDVDCTGPYHQVTILQAAATRGCHVLVSELLKCQLDVNVSHYKHHTALYIMCETSDIRCLECLIYSKYRDNVDPTRLFCSSDVFVGGMYGPGMSTRTAEIIYETYRDKLSPHNVNIISLLADCGLAEHMAAYLRYFGPLVPQHQIDNAIAAFDHTKTIQLDTVKVLVEYYGDVLPVRIGAVFL